MGQTSSKYGEKSQSTARNAEVQRKNQSTVKKAEVQRKKPKYGAEVRGWSTVKKAKVRSQSSGLKYGTEVRQKKSEVHLGG